MFNYYKNYYYIKKNVITDIIIGTILMIFSFYSGIKAINITIEIQNKLLGSAFFTIIEIVIIYYASIMLHEIGHTFLLKFYKYDFRNITVGPIVIDNDEKYKFKISKSRFFVTGFTITKISSFLKNEDDYLFLKRNFKIILLGGTCINVILIFIGIMLFNINSLMHIGYILIFINIAMIITSMFSNGDIKDFISMRKNPDRVSLYLLKEFEFEDEINNIVKVQVIRYINSMLLRRHYSLELIVAINIILNNKRKIKDENLIEIYKFLEWFKIEYRDITKKDVLLRVSSKKLMETLNKI